MTWTRQMENYERTMDAIVDLISEMAIRDGLTLEVSDRTRLAKAQRIVMDVRRDVNLRRMGKVAG